MGVNNDDPRSPYHQVADAIQDEIKSGQLPPGKRLPSIRDLQDRFEVSGMTIQAALRELRSAGLITTQQGRGTFVRSDALEIIDRKQTETESPDYVALSRRLDTLEASMREMADHLTAVETAVQSVKHLVQPAGK